MQKGKRNSMKGRNTYKSRSTSKKISKKSSRSSINFFSNNFNSKKVLLIQRNWRLFYKNKIEGKIITIQKIYKGYLTRQLFDEVYILNKKLECFFYIIRTTMFKHAINYDYLANKRIEYYSDHKNTKYFLLLQRRIRYFLFMKKIKVLEKIGLFNNIYIQNEEFRTKINSKQTADKYLAKPIIKYHKPLSKIIMIQRNYLIHAKVIRKMIKNNINKIHFNKCPLITKEEKFIDREKIKEKKIILNKVINDKKDFYTKINYDYGPLLFIQRQYKERFEYKKENYKLKKHSKLLKKVRNKHHYIYHSYVVDGIYDVLTIQKNIRYLLYRRHSMVNLLKKIKINKCEVKKQYEERGNFKKYFYEEFARRLVIIIRRFFVSINFKILKKYFKKKKLIPFAFSDYNYLDSTSSNSKNELNYFERRRNSITTEPIINIIKTQQKQIKAPRKETSSTSSNKEILQAKHGNLISNSESKNFKQRNTKKKVTFKSDTKVNKKIIKNEELPRVPDSPSRSSSKIKSRVNKGFSKYRSQFNNQYITPFKGK